MPQKKAAVKALKQSQKRYEATRILKKNIKDLRKKALQAVKDKKTDDALKLYHDVQKAVDKASKTGKYMSKNTAARYKANLMKAIQSTKAEKKA